MSSSRKSITQYTMRSSVTKQSWAAIFLNTWFCHGPHRAIDMILSCAAPRILGCWLKWANVQVDAPLNALECAFGHPLSAPAELAPTPLRSASRRRIGRTFVLVTENEP